jgi:hypothetical protein
MDHELVSPELALVDPDLAARARRALPEPDTFAWLEATRRVPATPAPPARRLDLARAGRSAVLVLLAASLLVNADLLFERRDAAPASLSRAAAPAARKQPPRYGVRGAERKLVAPARRAAPPQRHRASAGSPASAPAKSLRLKWPKASSAVQYDVVIWRGHERVLDLWTRVPQLDVATLPCSQARKLTPRARHLWFVYPQVSRGKTARFGALLKWGVFYAKRRPSCA